MRFRDVVAGEFRRRQQQNPRYSLRGFARALRVHHSTLSRLLNGQRPIQPDAISALGPRMGLGPDHLQAFIAREEIELVNDAIGRSTFRPDSRGSQTSRVCQWIA
ncbi:MAG: helix-turn-helix domain-containing protein [Vicinamibacterales bacterium]